MPLEPQFQAAISEEIWEAKYRFKAPLGGPAAAEAFGGGSNHGYLPRKN